jgi:hypothetical protein
MDRHNILLPLREILPLAADEVRFAQGPFNGFPDLAEVEIEFTGRCVSGWPRPGGKHFPGKMTVHLAYP